MDLLTQRHAEGVRFEAADPIERCGRVAVRLRGGYKVFTFAGDAVILLEDCVDRDDALAKLAR